MMRMTRAAILNLLALPYIEMPHLKGFKRWRVIAVHAPPNALVPIISVIALNFANLIAGVVLVEVVFVYPGLGLGIQPPTADWDGMVRESAKLIVFANFAN